MAVSPNLPGRLGAPDMQLRDDPRADPRMLGSMAAMGLDVAGEPTPVTADSTLEDLLDYVGEAAAGFTMLGDVLTAELAPIEGVVREVEVIRGPDGNDITLFVHRPENSDGPLPGLLHLHGGGMVMLEAPNLARTQSRQA
jgi:acetyl esterase